MAFKIKKATIEDIFPVSEYLNAFFSLGLEGISLRPNGLPFEEVRRKLPTNPDCTDKLCLVAETGQNIIGCLTFARHAKIEYRHAGEFGMTILPAYWRKGVGSALMLEMEAWCQKHNVSKIELGVWSNNDGAISLYEKHGYLVEGRRKRSIRRGEKFHDLVLMGKWVG